MPETEDYLSNNKVGGYIGFDPTSDSLHIGSLVQIMILVHFKSMATIHLLCLLEVLQEC